VDLLSLEFGFGAADQCQSAELTPLDWSQAQILLDTHRALMTAIDEFSITDLRRHIEILENIGEHEKSLA
jgi:hypothetical protein